MRDSFGPPGLDVEIACLHCYGVFRSKQMKLERRFCSVDRLWWCPDRTCNGAGFMFDLFPTSIPFGRGIKDRAKLPPPKPVARITRARHLKAAR